MENPCKPNYGWLRPHIQELIRQRRDRGESDQGFRWQVESIRSILFEPFPHPQRWITIDVRGHRHWKRVDRISLPMLLCLEEFMAERDALWETRKDMTGVRDTDDLKKRIVIAQHQPYATPNVGRVLGHAKTVGRDNLGDCWLFQVKVSRGWGKRPQYVWAKELSLLPVADIKTRRAKRKKPATKKLEYAPNWNR